MPKLTLPTDSPLLNSDFIFGVATSSFQIEGAANSRLPSIWDTFCQKPGAIKDNSHGLVACDHVARWQQDVELIAALNVDAYRLSMAWGRVMHQDGSLNPEGLAFYQNLIAALNNKGIKVFLTFYHWDLPQYLEEEGGWLNRQTAYAFADYVDAVAKELGDSVYSYATLNEPFCSAYLGYEIGIHAPGITGQKNGRQAAHHLLLAHGLAMQALRKHCPNSECGIVLNFATAHSHTQSQADITAAKRGDEYMNLWYLLPIIEKRYPDVITLIAPENRPEIAEGDFDLIGQAVDFIGINYYTRAVYADDGNGWFNTIEASERSLTDMGWEVYPEAFTELLVDYHTRFKLPPLYITENGAAMVDTLENGEVKDETRVAYFQSHLEAVDSAMGQGVNMKGYFAWSLMDNFEWAEGYLKRFGIVYVDYQSQARILKDSAKAYRDLLGTRAKT